MIFFLFYCQDVVAGIDGNKEPDYIEEMINKQKSLIQVLRLLCLMSLAQGGLKVKLYDHFRREIVQVKFLFTKKKEGRGGEGVEWEELLKI